MKEKKKQIVSGCEMGKKNRAKIIPGFDISM